MYVTHPKMYNDIIFLTHILFRKFNVKIHPFTKIFQILLLNFNLCRKNFHEIFSRDENI